MSSTSIRMKDIKFKKEEADFMCLADKTLKTLFDYLKDVYKDRPERLLIFEDDD